MAAVPLPSLNMTPDFLTEAGPMQRLGDLSTRPMPPQL